MALADDLVAAAEPWITPDFETYLRAIGEMFSEAELFAADVLDADGNVLYEGWTILFDPDRCPAKALPYLAQVIGERLPVGIAEPYAREWIKDAPNRRRGTTMSLVRVAQRSLTGQRTVQLIERSGAGGGDDQDRLVLNTYAVETPDPARTERELRRDALPFDVELVYQAISGQTWEGVRTTHATWADVQADYENWAAAQADMPGVVEGQIYTREPPS